MIQRNGRKENYDAQSKCSPLKYYASNTVFDKKKHRMEKERQKEPNKSLIKNAQKFFCMFVFVVVVRKWEGPYYLSFGCMSFDNGPIFFVPIRLVFYVQTTLHNFINPLLFRFMHCSFRIIKYMYGFFRDL